MLVVNFFESLAHLHFSRGSQKVRWAIIIDEREQTYDPWLCRAKNESYIDTELQMNFNGMTT